MPNTTPPETAALRLTLDISYTLNGVAVQTLVERLERVCDYLYEVGMLTDATAAEIDATRCSVALVPTRNDDESEEAIAISDFLQGRVDDGDLAAEDIGKRMMRYGLMPPAAFLDEMRERMAVDA